MEEKMLKKSPSVERYYSRLENVEKEMDQHWISPRDLSPKFDLSRNINGSVSNYRSENTNIVQYNADMSSKISKINDLKLIYNNFEKTKN